MPVSDKETVRAMLDRRIENIIFPLKDNLVAANPILEPIANGFWGQIINWINTKVDLIMDLSFPTGTETAEQGIENMDKILNALIVNKLDKSGIDASFLNMDLSKLLK